MRPPAWAASAVALVAALAACGTGTADRRGHSVDPPVERRVILGAAVQNRAELQQREAETGQRFGGVRIFRRWDQVLVDDDLRWARDSGHTVFLSVKSRRLDGTVVPWREIAEAGPGSPLRENMTAQAEQLRQFGSTIYFVFNHEPEARPSQDMGTPADFVAAWTKLVDTYRAVGTTNVRYVWTMTNLGFERDGGALAEAYYPGDRHVDAIAIDAYNLFTCLGPATPWRSMAELIEPQRAFARRHPGKPLMVLEWGTVEDPARPGRKAEWLRETADLFRRPEYARYTALLHWDGRNSEEYRERRCQLDYRSSPSALAAWREMAASSPYRGA